MTTTGSAGRAAEAAACRFLQARGLSLLEQNFRTPVGEIDLVMMDGEILVFVEVRSRSSANFMRPEESIDLRKQRRLLKAAALYMQRHGLLSVRRARFDVIVVTGSGRDAQFRWIAGAFEA